MSLLSSDAPLAGVPAGVCRTGGWRGPELRLVQTPKVRIRRFGFGNFDRPWSKVYRSFHEVGLELSHNLDITNSTRE